MGAASVAEPRKLGLGCKSLLALLVVVTMGLGVATLLCIERRRFEHAQLEITALFEGARQEYDTGAAMNDKATYERMKVAWNKLAMATTKIDSLRDDALGRPLSGTSPEALDEIATNVSMLSVLVRKARKMAAIELEKKREALGSAVGGAPSASLAPIESDTAPVTSQGQ